MTYTFDEYNYTLRFEKDELLLEGLQHFVKEQNIRGGWIMGLGGLQWAELGFYNLKTQEYEWKKLDVQFELSNMTGNIAWQDDEPVLHLHATVADAGLRTYAGHLREAKVAGTVEVFIHKWLKAEGLSRTKDPETGLNVLSL